MRTSKGNSNNKVVMVSSAHLVKPKPKKVSQSVSHNTYEYGSWKKRLNDTMLKFIINCKDACNSLKKMKDLPHKEFSKHIIKQVRKILSQFQGISKDADVIEEYLSKESAMDTVGVSTSFLCQLTLELAEFNFSQEGYCSMILRDPEYLKTQGLLNQFILSFSNPNKARNGKKKKTLKTENKRDINMSLNKSTKLADKMNSQDKKFIFKSNDFASQNLKDISNFTPEGYCSIVLKNRVNRLKSIAKTHIKSQSEERYSFILILEFRSVCFLTTKSKFPTREKTEKESMSESQKDWRI
jgi:hypothetical protein